MLDIPNKLTKKAKFVFSEFIIGLVNIDKKGLKKDIVKNSAIEVKIIKNNVLISQIFFSLESKLYNFSIIC